MYLTGFADEASKGIDGQIAATRELGWTFIESRGVDGKNIHDLSDAEFDHVAGALESAGVRVNCFGSAIANWGKSILEPMDSSLAEARRAIPRMHRLGTRLIRIMSFAVLKDRDPEDQMETERFRRLRELLALFQDAGITPVHENCMNYGGMGWTYTLRLLENVPGLKLVFDTGNPVFTPDYTKPEPRPRQSAWEFYSHVKSHVAYVHIKDGVWNAEKQVCTYTYPGEGEGDVRRILTDLLQNGYDGGISIEPHLSAVFHEERGETQASVMHRTYVEYGRRLEKLIAGIQDARAPSTKR
ncbi:MAG: sugar phosphate isomerase/epimerase [Lentisphaerae bacterium]|nr:sugar phosphate isomerase/epimerase [Lentisphaerota bacterium]